MYIDISDEYSKENIRLNTLIKVRKQFKRQPKSLIHSYLKVHCE